MADFLIILILLFAGAIGLLLGSISKITWRPRARGAGFWPRQSDRALFANLPIACWLEREGRLIWSNKVHRRLCRQNGHPITLALMRAPRQDGGISVAQFELKHPGTESYLLVSLPHPKGVLVFAYAERIFETTSAARANVGLTDAFSKLPIGIAVFDKNSDLVSFNPVLENQLGLPPSWLSARPSLRVFLDRLRNDGTLPEPRDFNKWRDEIIALNTKGERYLYSEDWYLIDEKVLRVTGQPSYRETTTFTFEDISRQIAIERQYGIEIARLHLVLDHLDNGIVIFDKVGTLNYTNAEFQRLWNNEFDDPVAFDDVSKFIALLDTVCLPNPDLADMRQFLLNETTRSAWKSKLVFKSSGVVHFRMLPLMDGYSLLEFSDATMRDPIGRIKTTQSA